MKHTFYLLFFVILAHGLFINTCAQTTISGNVGDMVLDSSGNPFIVEKDITVPKGKTLTIKEGCALLFKPFTGFTIEGNCSVNGTQEHPVVFTSINDAMYNKTSTQPAGAFDWNGITVAKKSGNIAFNYIDVRFSVYGIKSQNPNIVLKQSTFKQNGQFHFTINDKIQTVQDNTPFSFNENRQAQATAPAKSERSRNFKIVRYSLLGIGAASVVAGVVFNSRSNNLYNKYIADKNYDIANHDTEWQSVKNAETTRNVLYVLAGAGAAAFAVTFLF